jgi:hypothetical protein
MTNGSATDDIGMSDIVSHWVLCLMSILESQTWDSFQRLVHLRWLKRNYQNFRLGRTGGILRLGLGSKGSEREKGLQAHNISPNLGHTQFRKEQHAWERGGCALAESKCQVAPVEAERHTGNSLTSKRAVAVTFSITCCRAEEQIRISKSGMTKPNPLIGIANRFFGIAKM